MIADSGRDAPISIAIAGGGTGGHLYPAMTIVGRLEHWFPNLECVVFGTRRSTDMQVLSHSKYDLVPQPLSPFRWAPWGWPRFVWNLNQSSTVCRDELSRRRPGVVIGTGGLASIPAIRQARRMGIPTVLLNPDVVPGKANRLLAAGAEAVLAQWEDTRKYLPPGVRVLVTGCPVRPEFHQATREEGVARFGLDPRRRTVLVTGASQGARSINDAVLANLDFLRNRRGWQILHLTGTGDLDRVSAAYAAGGRDNLVAVAYTPHMAEALAASDLVVSRAGASTLAEILAVGRASILMPYPHHRDRHQTLNALCLVREGAARMLEELRDAPANAVGLGRLMDELMSDDARREEMAARARQTGRRDALEAAAALIAEVGGLSGDAAVSTRPELIR